MLDDTHRLHHKVELGGGVICRVFELRICDIRNMLSILNDDPEHDLNIIDENIISCTEFLTPLKKQLNESQSEKLANAYNSINAEYIAEGKKNQNSKVTYEQAFKKTSITMVNIISHGHVDVFKYGYSFYKEVIATLEFKE